MCCNDKTSCLTSKLRDIRNSNEFASSASFSAMQTEVTRIHPTFCLFIQLGSRRASTTDPEFKPVRQ